MQCKERIPPALWATGGLGFLHPIQFNPSNPEQGLEERFTPPPTSSPGSKIARSRSLVGAYFRLFRHLGRHHFLIIFQHVFETILAPSWLPEWLQNRAQIELRPSKIALRVAPEGVSERVSQKARVAGALRQCLCTCRPDESSIFSFRRL